MEYKLKVIKDLEQYNAYCDLHESLMIDENPRDIDTIELLELLIEDFDAKGRKTPKVKPVELLKSLIDESWDTQLEFAQEVQVSPQLISDILNHRRRITKHTAQKLASFFAMKREAFYSPDDWEEEKPSKKSQLQN